MRGESLHHQWACYKKEDWWYITSHSFYGICNYYRNYFILETRPDFFIHIAHHVWFDEYNHHLYIYDRHTSGSLLIQQHPESLIHNLELINLILCKLDLNPLHSLIQQFSHMKLSYPLLDRKLVLIYLAMNILQSLMSLIKFKTHQSVINFQHRLNQICGSLI